MSRRYPEQEPPFCIQVEFSEGCNLMCSFCGIQGIREKAGGPFKFMTNATAMNVADSIAKAGWTSRIEFAMHGEPTMNPDFINLVGVFRKFLPDNQLMMTSNGAGFMKDTRERITAIFEAGLNILALDDYKNVRIVPKVLERLGLNPEDIRTEFNEIPVLRYPEAGLEYSPHRRHGKRHRMILAIKDITEAEEGSHAVINNHAGCGAAPNDSKAGQRCAKPFRELGVRWDGKVAGCCVDWRGLYHIGHTQKTPIDELWNSEAFGAMRRKLYHGQRDFGPCKGCDHATYRLGLLPDKLGQDTLPKPGAYDAEIIRKALAPRPMAEVVLRPWEKK